MIEAYLPIVAGTFAVVAFAVVTLSQALFWIRLACAYPLAEEWPDRTFFGTPVAVGLFLDRVSIGANSRGITFHGLLMRWSGTGVFVPWQSVTATPVRSLLLRNAVRLTFRSTQGVHLELPGSVWANVLAVKPARSPNPPAGV